MPWGRRFDIQQEFALSLQVGQIIPGAPISHSKLQYDSNLGPSTLGCERDGALTRATSYSYYCVIGNQLSAIYILCSWCSFSLGSFGLFALTTFGHKLCNATKSNTSAEIKRGLFLTLIEPWVWGYDEWADHCLSEAFYYPADSRQARELVERQSLPKMKQKSYVWLFPSIHMRFKKSCH